MDLSPAPKHVPEIDPGFVSAKLWNQEYIKKAQATPSSAPLAIGLQRPDGTASVFRCPMVLPADVDFHLTETYVERIVKFLLWGRGGSRIFVSGPSAPEIVKMLQIHYCKGGKREFDVDFVLKLFEEPPSFQVCTEAELPAAKSSFLPLGRNLDGNRIGFDLGGSDRKCAAVVDGEVVFSEEVRWDPYFEGDPTYHREGVFLCHMHRLSKLAVLDLSLVTTWLCGMHKGIQHSLKLAEEAITKLGKIVDAIGGSSAGVYINNIVRVASLFRGVQEKGVSIDFQSSTQPPL